MSDMLVNLLKLPPLEAGLSAAHAVGVSVRHAEVFERGAVCGFVADYFSSAWAEEIAVGFARQPVTVFVAAREGVVVGFAAYECTRRAFFGPTGVVESERGRGVGRALLVASLWGLREMGYVYGVIGGVGPAEFYARAVGAFEIPDSAPGIYADPLRRQQN